jgi:hypothetical protein
MAHETRLLNELRELVGVAETMVGTVVRGGHLTQESWSALYLRCNSSKAAIKAAETRQSPIDWVEGEEKPEAPPGYVYYRAFQPTTGKRGWSLFLASDKSVDLTGPPPGPPDPPRPEKRNEFA